MKQSSFSISQTDTKWHHSACSDMLLCWGFVILLHILNCLPWIDTNWSSWQTSSSALSLVPLLKKNKNKIFITLFKICVYIFIFVYIFKIFQWKQYANNNNCIDTQYGLTIRNVLFVIFVVLNIVFLYKPKPK